MLFCFHGLLGQKIDKYYTSSSVTGGIIYYINLNDKFEEVEGKCSLIYDISILSSNDSCYLNFSLFSSEIYRIDSLGIKIESIEEVFPVRKLFIEPGKYWHHRYSVRLSNNLVEQMYRTVKPPILTLYTNKVPVILSMKSKKWQKSSQIGKEIFELITYNQ